MSEPSLAVSKPPQHSSEQSTVGRGEGSKGSSLWQTRSKYFEVVRMMLQQLESRSEGNQVIV